MKRFQIFLAWLSTFLLVGTNLAWEGCNTKEPSPAPVLQQSPAGAPAPQQDSAAVPVTNAAATQTAAAQLQQLPEVNLTAAGLDELLAPIALYPDPVLAVMLQAAVDPQEVMDGGNWLALDQNQNLKEAALDEASKKAGFTPVMQALLHYPTIVDLMCTQFDWTKQLGAVYQANPKAVLDSVQRLRAQAVDNGALKSSSQMKVDVTQSNGQQVVELKPADPKVIYVPQYNPNQVFQTTTTTTRPDGTTTTTTTTSGPAPTASATSNTTVVQQSSGVSTGTAVMIGLLSFGAGVALGSAINKNNYYYPAWGYGGVWYGPRPYYPPPYHPVYYPGWGPGYHYNRPVHYGNTNIYINNNYYNRFNNNNNLNPNYKPRPVPYSQNPNSTYSKNMGSQPGSNQGVHYRPANTNASTGSVNPNIQNRPNAGNGATTPTQRPAQGNNTNNWKGQTTYQGNQGTNNRVNTGAPPPRNPSGDRGFAQNGGVRPNAGNASYNRPSTGNVSNNGPSTGNAPNARPAPGNTTTNRPSAGNTPATRPATANQPGARPTPANQPSTRPASQPQQQNRPQESGGALNGASNPQVDRAASNRGHASMGAPTSRQGQRSGSSKKP
jgi:Protein of unknown function (DUF3300)